MAYPAVIYPNYVTPHGEYYLRTGRIPQLALTAYDGSIQFFVLGGRAITDHLTPESVKLKDIKGLVAPWQTIDQKGATQDGVTFVTSLYDPLEIEMVVEARGRDPQSCRKVLTDLYASLDSIKKSELSFYTHELGRWWADVRWLKTPIDPLERINTPRQVVSLVLRSDTPFWRSDDDTDLFKFEYDSMIDTFDIDYSGANNLGPNWPQYYSGPGGGYCSTTSPAPAPFDIHQARWYISGDDAREVVNGPYKDFSTDTDTQIVEMVLGSTSHSSLYGEAAYNDLWGRMGRNLDGTWNGYGIRARVGWGTLTLTAFAAFAPVWTRAVTIFNSGLSALSSWLPPLFGEKFTLLCGREDKPRSFAILRNGIPVLEYDEVGTASSLGASYRGVGFGMAAADGVFSQATPAYVRKVSAGDNATVSQTGFLRRLNIGDQPMFDDYTFFGPGTVRMWNGPGAGADEYVEFGPLLPNQVMFLRTHPGKRSVHDLTVTPPTAQEYTAFQEALNKFLSFAFANNVPPLIQSIVSKFGILAPQGNPFSLLKGRWSDAAAIPAKSPGLPAQPYFVKCEIVNGTADSKLIASGTPLRRYPL